MSRVLWMKFCAVAVRVFLARIVAMWCCNSVCAYRLQCDLILKDSFFASRFCSRWQVGFNASVAQVEIAHSVAPRNLTFNSKVANDIFSFGLL